MIGDDEQSIDKIALIKKKEAEDLAQLLSQKYGMTYLDLSRQTIDLDALGLITEEEARSGQIAIFQRIGKTISIGIRNPELPKTKEILENLKNSLYKINLFMVSEASLGRAWSRYSEIQQFKAVSRGLISISPENLDSYIKQIKHLEDLAVALEPLLKTKEIHRISEVAEAILAGAFSLEASDVHVEPQETDTRLRFRLDGVLQDVTTFPLKIYKLLLSRIKLIAEIKLNVTDRPQDGRFTIRVSGADVEVRTSTLPGPYGESIVLRILHPKSIGISFEELGMQKELQEIILKEIQKPNGMILTTGPTGSGKTTTLYAFIKKISTPDIKVITIENPIEYHIAGISQSQVDPEGGYGFADALKSILRQDPDVILVGEIRDLDTAKTAMNAALTGHLVLSTLHTNNAFGTIPRLLDLGVQANSIAPAINVAMAQRLVRVLCKSCKKQREPGPEELDYVKRIIADMPENYRKIDVSSAKFWGPVGCDVCHKTGYKGRIGVYEAFQIDDSVEKIIITNPLESEFRAAAKKQQRLTMEQDGVLKILDGITSIAELQRVVGE